MNRDWIAGLRPPPEGMKILVENIDGSNSIFIIMPVFVLLALFVGVALPLLVEHASLRQLRRDDQGRLAPGGVSAMDTSQPAGQIPVHLAADPLARQQRAAAEAEREEPGRAGPR
jgi:hypothetical protein